MTDLSEWIDERNQLNKVAYHENSSDQEKTILTYNFMTITTPRSLPSHQLPTS